MFLIGEFHVDPSCYVVLFFLCLVLNVHDPENINTTSSHIVFSRAHCIKTLSNGETIIYVFIGLVPIAIPAPF